MHEYVRSAFENTEFHRKFTYGANLRLIDEARSEIAPDFEVLRGRARVGWTFTFTAAAYNLVWMRNLLTV